MLLIFAPDSNCHVLSVTASNFPPRALTAFGNRIKVSIDDMMKKDFQTIIAIQLSKISVQ